MIPSGISLADNASKNYDLLLAANGTHQPKTSIVDLHRHKNYGHPIQHCKNDGR